MTKKPAYLLRPHTALINKGFDPSLSVGSARPAVFRSSTYVFSSPEAAQQAFSVALGKADLDEDTELIYSRLSHPNAEILETHLCELEPQGTASAVFNSGMAAISTLFFAFSKPGRNFIYTTPLYGGTHHFIHEVLKPLGFGHHPVMAGQTHDIENKIKNTKGLDLIFIETPSNPTLTMTDIASIVACAKKHPDQPLVVVDNTFMGPAFQHPLDLGADLTVYSATKFLGGFSDLLGGVVIGKDEKKLQALRGLRGILGNILQPDECWILDSRLPMVNLRMDAQCNNAQLILKEVKTHPKVESICYPLYNEDSSAQAIFEKQCRQPGSIFSLRVQGGQKGAFDMIRHLKIIKNAVSLGGMESLCCHPATTTHSEMTPEERSLFGITDDLVRLSIGLEDVQDLTEDIKGALDHI